MLTRKPSLALNSEDNINKSPDIGNKSLPSLTKTMSHKENNYPGKILVHVDGAQLRWDWPLMAKVLPGSMRCADPDKLKT